MKTCYVMQHPVDMTGIYLDAHIDYWGEIYLANPMIRAHGVLFGTFLMAPLEILHAVVMAPIDVRQGLLARQRAVQRRLDLEAAGEQLPLQFEAMIVALEHKGARVSDGRWIEPLKHRTWPRHANRRDAEAA